MNLGRVAQWFSTGGSVNRRGYWFLFILPSLGLGLIWAIARVVPPNIPFMIPAVVLQGMGLLAIWIFVAGNIKRVRHLRMAKGTAAKLLGLWATAMGIATVSAVGLLAFGMLALMSNGGPDGQALMALSVLVFLAPIVVALFVVGFMPGGLPPDVAPSSAEGTMPVDVVP